MTAPAQDSLYPLLERALTDIQSGSAVVSVFSPDLKLGGREGALDSLDTMLFLDRVEELLEEREGRAIPLVTDEAFLREENPFHSMRTLDAYIRELIGEGSP